MGWLSTLGKIGKIAGAGAATYFTGGMAAPLLAGAIKGSMSSGGGGKAGALGNIMSAAGDAGTVMGGQQAGKNNALMGQGQLNAQRDRNLIDLFQAQQGAQNQAGQLDLQRKQFEQVSRGTDAKQAMISALLGGGITPTSIKGGAASGGLLRSLNANPEALAAMKTLSSKASGAQNTPAQFSGGQMLTAPKLTDVPKIDTGGGIMGTITKIAQLAGAASPYLQGSGGSSQQAGVPDLSSVGGVMAGLDPRFMLPGQNVPLDIPALKKAQAEQADGGPF